MSEPKRIALIPLGGGEPLTQLPGKKEKKNSKPPKTQRFTLTLDDSTEKSCPEFNFANLVSSTVKKKETTNGSGPNPLDPFDDGDEDQLRSIAKKFEEKYGLPVGKKKKSRKYDDYVDLGAGYDETDPFIDNTDAYDEVVPAEVTTAHGGFYINSGALEFKATEKNSESESESSSSSSESESEDSDSDMSTAAGNNKKRRIIDSDDDSGDGNLAVSTGEANNKKKKARLEEVAEQVKPKKPSSSPKVEAPEGEKLILKDVIRATQTKRNNDTVEVPPKPKVAVSNAGNLTAEESTKASETNLRKDQAEPKLPQALPVNAVVSSEANDSSSSSSDSSDSSSSSSDSDSEEEDGNDDDEPGKDKSTAGENDEASKLPSSLTSSTLNAIEEIKKAAISSDKTGKCRFFSPEINRLLLAVELQARQYSCSKRQAIYTYLTRFLPCTKHTLLKRAKNLVLEDVESKLKPAIQKLQAAIEKVMGEQIERHATQCQRLAEANPERYLEYYRYAWDPDLEPAGGSDDDDKKPEKSSKPAHPRRRFQWNKEIRSILNQVVYLKMECYNWSKLRKESASEYLMRFLESDLKNLWPKGWMTSKILFKESKEAHAFVTAKGAVTKPAPAGRKSVAGVIDALIQPSTIPTASNSHAAHTQSQFKEQLKTNTASTQSQVKEQPKTNVASTQSQLKEQAKTNLKERTQTMPVNLMRAEGIAAVALQNLVKEQPKLNQKERITNAVASRPEIVLPRHENNGSINKLDKVKSEPTPQLSKADIQKPRQRAETVPRQDSKEAKQRTTNFSDPLLLVKPSETESHHSAKLDYPTDLSKKNNVRESIIQLCPDVSVIKNENSRIAKSDTTKVRFESPASSSLEQSKFNRADSSTSNESKHDEIQCLTPLKTDPSTSKSDSDSYKPNKLVKTPVVPSSSSLASFVDSGLRWTARESGSNKPGEHHVLDATQRKESHIRSETSKEEPQQEDEESVLQRDLARVLEQIGQITSQVDGKDSSQQTAQVSVIGESKPKSVIKMTGSANLNSNVGGPNHAPKQAATSLLQRSIPNSSGTSGSSRPANSTNTSPQNQTGHIKFAHSSSKMLPTDLLNQMASFTPNWQPYYPSDTQSPEKRKSSSESTSPQHPVGNQMSGGSSYAARNSPNTMHRNMVPSVTHILPTSNSSAFLKNVSHTVESMLQQTPPSQTLHDSHLAFLQRKSQKSAGTENNYYSIHGPSDPANSS